MHALSATLAVAIRAPRRDLALSAIVTAMPCEAHMWAFSSLHVDAHADTKHATAYATASGALYQARLDGTTVKVRRVADPASAGSWASAPWVTIATGAQTYAGIAIASDPTLTENARVWWVDDGDGRTVRSAWTIDGVAWSSEIVIVETPGYQVRKVDGVASDGEVHCLYVLDQVSGSPDEYLVAIERAGGVWTGYSLQGVGRYTVDGIGIARPAGTSLIYVLVADGVGAGGLERRLAMVIYDTGTNAWTNVATLITHSGGSGFGFREPRLVAPSVASPRWAFAWVESFAGSGATPAYERPMLALSPTHRWIPEWTPWDTASAYGYQLVAASDGVWYLLGAREAHRAPSDDLATNRLDISADVASLAIDTPRAHGPTTARIRLADTGVYANAGVTGTISILRPGTRLSVKLGLRTAAGTEGIWQEPLWIDRIDHVFDCDRWWLDVHAIDAWAILDRARPVLATQFTSPVSIGDLLERVIWRVAAAGPTSPSSLSATLATALWSAPRTFGSIARELLDLAGARLRFRTDQNASDGAGWTSTQAQAIETTVQPPTYAYGVDHAVLSAVVSSGGQTVNHIAADGAATGPFQTDSHDHSHMRRWWRRLTRHVVDRRLTSLSAVQSVGDAALRADGIGEGAGATIVVPMNPAQEIGDTIELTIPRAGITAAAYVIVGKSVVVERDGPRRRAVSRFTLAAR